MARRKKQVCLARAERAPEEKFGRQGQPWAPHCGQTCFAGGDNPPGTHVSRGRTKLFLLASLYEYVCTRRAACVLREKFEVVSSVDQPANKPRVAAPKPMQLANLRSAIFAALSTSKVPTEEPPTVGFRLLACGKPHVRHCRFELDACLLGFSPGRVGHGRARQPS